MGSMKKSVVGMLAIGIVAAGMIVSRHAAAAAPQTAGASGYHLIKRIKLGGTGGWDYLTVDQATHRVFISRGTKVIVVDPTTEKVLGEIPDTPGVHGIALVAEFNRGYTTNGRSLELHHLRYDHVEKARGGEDRQGSRWRDLRPVLQKSLHL